MAVLLPGVALYFLPLAGMSGAQRHLLAIFVATIVALVAQPVPMGVSVLLAMTLLALTRTLAPARVLSGFANLTVWLIVPAFLFARAVTASGLGTRIGYLFIRRFARTPLRLAYSLAAADLVLAPFIPSDTGRGGGIIFPITRSVAAAFGSEPGPTSRAHRLVPDAGFLPHHLRGVGDVPDGDGGQPADRRLRTADRARRPDLAALVSGFVPAWPADPGGGAVAAAAPGAAGDSRHRSGAGIRRRGVAPDGPAERQGKAPGGDSGRQ